LNQGQQDFYQKIRKDVKQWVTENLDKENKTLYLSEVFKWFKDVFEEKYGSIRKTVAEFINNDDANFILNNDINIEYIKYNWNLNSQ